MLFFQLNTNSKNVSAITYNKEVHISICYISYFSSLATDSESIALSSIIHLHTICYLNV